MKKYIPYYIGCLLAVAMALAACTDEATPALSSEREDQVVFALTVGAGESTDVQTRASEPGWGDWNENTITKADIYIVFANGAEEHFPLNASDLEGSPGYYTWTSDITADELIGATIYVVANCDNSTNSWSGMENLHVTGLGNPAGKQESFLMDGKTEVTADNIEGNKVITVDLKRAAAKIRLAFASDTDWEDVSYRFCQYATTTTAIDKNEESYLGDNAGIATYPTENGEPSMAEAVSENSDYLHEYTHIVENEGGEEVTITRKGLVLYSYANDWFDESKANQINQVEPIVDDRQTYILLYAPYGEGTNKQWYYYKVPVNFRLPTNNDDAIPNEDDGYDMIDPDTYRHLYRLQRNYIYDITVNIDRPGGTELDPGKLVNLTYEVEPWDREDVTVNYEDNLSYRSDKWVEDTYIDYLDEEKTNVHIYPDRPAELRFTIQSPLDATWRAQLNGTDVSSFEFVHKETVDGEERFVGVGATDEGNTLYDGNGNPISQSIYVRCTDPSSEETHSVQLHVYVTYYGQTYELDLTDTEGSDVNYFTITQGM